MNRSRYTVSSFELPPDIGWEAVEDAPDELTRVLEIYACAKRDNVDGNLQRLSSIDEFYEEYDSVSGQDIAIARDESNRIIGVASLDLRRNPPFFEGVAVHPGHRGSGVARQLAKYLFDRASELEVQTIHGRSQPSSLPANLRLLQSLGLEYDVSTQGTYPLMSIDLGAKQ